MSSIPKVTVLMPVYNGENYIKEAIDSVLKQTFKDFEFLIINDGSTDRSQEIIRSYIDNRIRLVNNERNLKVIDTLNRGLELAKGLYIARMDCDDICLPNRLQIQVDFMDSNPDVGVCGSWIELFGDTSWARKVKHPTKHEDICARMLFENVIAHPTVILRRDYFIKYNLTYPKIEHLEDWALWLECRNLFKMSNVNKVLLKYRISQQSICQSFQGELEINKQFILKNNLTVLIDNPKEIDQIQKSVFLVDKFKNKKDLKQTIYYILKINKVRNNKSKAIERSIVRLLFDKCYVASNLGFYSYNLFYKTCYKNIRDISVFNQIKFLVRCIIKK